MVYPLQKSSSSESGVSLCFLVTKAFNELEEYFPKSKTPFLNKLFINSRYFENSVPMATLSGNSKEYIINFEKDEYKETPVVIYVKIVESKSLLYVFLAIGGLLIGIIPIKSGFIETRKQAYYWLSISILIFFGAIVYTLSYLTIDQLTTDTTTIVTIGCFGGILLGLISSSLYKLVKAPQ